MRPGVSGAYYRYLVTLRAAGKGTLPSNSARNRLLGARAREAYPAIARIRLRNRGLRLTSLPWAFRKKLLLIDTYAFAVASATTEPSGFSGSNRVDVLTVGFVKGGKNHFHLAEKWEKRNFGVQL